MIANAMKSRDFCLYCFGFCRFLLEIDEGLRIVSGCGSVEYSVNFDVFGFHFGA
jgi:hypothetical protein